MTKPSDLTTRDAVKSWQGIVGAASDTQIDALVSAASRTILSFLGRPSILPRAWLDRYDGRTGLRALTLRNWPVIAVQSVAVGAVSLPPTNPANPSIGYALEASSYGDAPPGVPQAVQLFGAGVAGPQGVAVAYTAGYQETAAAVVPTGGGTFTPEPSYGAWGSDQGVVFAATGVALARVASAPTAGQYAVSTTGTYTFAAADAGKAIAIAFGYVPADLGQACVELVAHRMAAGSRVGVKSKSLGGQETVSFDISGVPDAVKSMLQPYRQVLPL